MKWNFFFENFYNWLIFINILNNISILNSINLISDRVAATNKQRAGREIIRKGYDNN